MNVRAKDLLQDWVLEALRASGGKGRILEVCKHIWRHHEAELRASGDLFYTWQYDVSWAAQKLRDSGKLQPLNNDRHGIWQIR